MARRRTRTLALCSSLLLQALFLGLQARRSEGGAREPQWNAPSANACGMAQPRCADVIGSPWIVALRGGSSGAPQYHPQVLQERIDRGLTPPPPQAYAQVQQYQTEGGQTPPPQNIHPMVLQERLERGLTPPPPQISPPPPQISPLPQPIHPQVQQDRIERGHTQPPNKVYLQTPSPQISPLPLPIHPQVQQDRIERGHTQPPNKVYLQTPSPPNAPANLKIGVQGNGCSVAAAAASAAQRRRAPAAAPQPRRFSVASAAEALRKGEELAANFAFEDAVSAFSAGIDLDADMAELYSARSKALLKLNRIEEALRDAVKVAAMSNGVPVILAPAGGWEQAGASPGGAADQGAGVLHAHSIAGGHVDGWGHGGGGGGGGGGVRWGLTQAEADELKSQNHALQQQVEDFAAATDGLKQRFLSVEVW